MSDLDRLQRELDELAAEAADLEQRRTSTELVHVGGGAEAAERQLSALKAQAERQAVLMKAKAAEVRAEAEAQRQKMLTIAREAERALEPVHAMVRDLQEGLHSIGLYLGTGERIVELRDGAPAPAETPISIRQMVLRMDEECAVLAEEGGIDARSIGEFDKWVLERPEHLEQVLPERKGVVGLIPRDPSRSKDGGAKAEENRETYWLIRNGDRLYRTTTDFIAVDRLIPGATEFTDLFKGRNGKALRPGSRDWEQAQDAAEEAERHYYRVALILEGLLHRTPVFEPLPMQGMSFLDESHHAAGRIRFIMDAEAALGDGHEPFDRWRARLNKQLRPGLRIIGQFQGYYGGLASHKLEGRYGNARLHPVSANPPEDGVIYELERVQGGKLGFKYERTDPIFRDGYDRHGRWMGRDNSPAKVRASCVVESGDDWVIPYDLASEEDLERFLRSRTDRRNYVSMFPVIKAALRAKRAEREAELPFRTMLAGVLARENDVSVAEAEQAVPELVEWYKTANRWHRPLVVKRRESQGGDGVLVPEADSREAAAVRLITAEHARRVRIARRKPDMELVRELRERFPATVMVGRRRSDGKYIAVVPERSDEQVFARIVVWGRRKGLDEDLRWQLVSKARAARWEPLWATDRWERWNHEAQLGAHLTDPEIEVLREKVSGDYEGRLLGMTLTGRELVTWVQAEPVRLGDVERPLSGDKGARGSVTGFYREWSRDADGTPRLASKSAWSGSGSYASQWTERGIFRDDESVARVPWSNRYRKHRVIWADWDAIREVRRDLDEFERRANIRSEYRYRCHPFTRAVREEWEAAWWEDQRQRFVAEFGKPHLWDGQRKIIQEQLRSSESLKAPTEGLGALVAFFVERDEDERLWDRLVADVLNEATGRGFEPEQELDGAILALRFTRPEPEAEPEAEVDWDAERDDDFDVQVNPEPLAELEAGEPVDAEVVE